MTLAPHIDPDNSLFPGDASPQPPFGLKDSVRSLFLWSFGVPHLAAWTGFTVLTSKFVDTRRIDRSIKMMALAVPALCGIKTEVERREVLDSESTYVYVANHVNIFDMFAIYRAVPGYTRSLEHAEHFSWPIFGSFVRAAGQIPVDPNNSKLTAKGMKKAAGMLKKGDSLVVLPEGQRTLDGSVGRFYNGAFRLAIKAGVPVVPMAIHGGRKVSRRGDWRMKPGTVKVIFEKPINTAGLTLRDTEALADEARNAVIRALRRENEKMLRKKTPGGR